VSIALIVEIIYSISTTDITSEVRYGTLMLRTMEFNPLP